MSRGADPTARRVSESESAIMNNPSGPASGPQVTFAVPRSGLWRGLVQALSGDQRPHSPNLPTCRRGPDSYPFPVVNTGRTRPARPFCILAYTEDLMLCVGNAVLKYPVETPMMLLGSLTHHGDLVAALALPPGPRAVEDLSFCRQDPEYVREETGFLKRRFSLDPVSRIHSHGSHDLSYPSSGDFATISSLAETNSLYLMGEIIITFHPHRDCLAAGGRVFPRPKSLFRARLHENIDGLQPVVNAYVCVRSERGYYEYEASNLLLLPGRSPYRSELERTGEDRAMGLAFDNDPYPIANVLIPRLLLFDREPSPSPQVPLPLLEECRTLPVEVSDRVEIRQGEEHWFVRIPVRAGVAVQCVYEIDSVGSPDLTAVLLQADYEEVHYITAEVTARCENPSMADIYGLVANGDLDPGARSPAPREADDIPPESPPLPERETSSPEEEGLPISNPEGESP